MMKDFRLPLRHMSIRVPWHDAGWDGRVCHDPSMNTACLILDRIRESRDDEAEQAICGKTVEKLNQSQWPACIAERGTFMAPFEVTRLVEHPYANSSDHHRHLKPTPFRNPAYSAMSVPFRWLMKEAAWEKAEELCMNVDPEREPDLPFETPWVQDHKNQSVILDTFFGALAPEKSLCFFYAKQVPFAEDARRVLIGVGRVLNIGSAVEYDHRIPRAGKHIIWERAIQHSIRKTQADGFLLPYHELMALQNQGVTFELEDYVAYVPDHRRAQFSYAAEHVTPDGAIDSLLSISAALRKAGAVLPESWKQQLDWIDKRLAEIWKLRGPFPGLGPALCSFGLEHGNLAAYEIAGRVKENEDPWPLVERAMKNPSFLSQPIAEQFSTTIRKKWAHLPDERCALIKLLSRFEMSVDQAVRFYVPEERSKNGLNFADSEIIVNPYILYEQDRISPDPIDITIIDRGMFPPEIVRAHHPLPEPSKLEDGSDARRVRALATRVLDSAANQGHTLLPQTQIIQEIREMPLSPACPVDKDLLRVVDDWFYPIILETKMKSGETAYQLGHLQVLGKTIGDSVANRSKGKRLQVQADWLQLLEQDLAAKNIGSAQDEEEKRAREEKAAALKEIAASRVSVLIGPAGTGKTTVLSVLANEPAIKASGVLMLAPTGKARVRLAQSTGQPALTLAQFLLTHGRYDEKTGRYHKSSRAKYEGAKTVIVDEASMLTEEQLGALLDALKGVERLVLTGDPRQLPPIGPGRPFVDIIEALRPKDVYASFPHIGHCYAELTVRRRQAGETSEDIQMADWFGGGRVGPGDDEIFDQIIRGVELERIKFVEWANASEFRDKLLDVLVAELKLAGIEDSATFDMKLGGTLYKDKIYFNMGSGASAEAWQILTPVRGQPYGTTQINKLVQKTFRRNIVEFARSNLCKVPKPMGPEEIVYGDKVINVVNHSRSSVFPAEDALGYIANGEIGVVVGQFKKADAKYDGAPRYLNVEFSSQKKHTYSFTKRDFGEEASPKLELAYSLTIHKAQGSEFGLTILVVPNPCRLLSRELLYTALTRQKDRIVVLHQGPRSELRKYSSAYYSETAARLTNLFIQPDIVQVNDKFLEDGLIHRTVKGEAVRSKSEVIITSLLAAHGIDYSYEKPFAGDDGSVRFPDFTIENEETGDLFLWEHCGMMSDSQYKKRWEKKRDWYKSQGVLPYEQGGGSRGALIVTEDNAAGGIDADAIDSLIRKLFKGE
ncbi:MAG: AAA family ATPase [Sporomusaceae bacterium]|nr:AAA family ATPase [Sporomusaceae bacterium]